MTGSIVLTTPGAFVGQISTGITTHGSVTIAGQTIGLQEAVPAPTGLTATAVSSSQIDLSWDAVEGA